MRGGAYGALAAGESALERLPHYAPAPVVSPPPAPPPPAPKSIPAIGAGPPRYNPPPPPAPVYVPPPAPISIPIPVGTITIPRLPVIPTPVAAVYTAPPAPVYTPPPVIHPVSVEAVQDAGEVASALQAPTIFYPPGYKPETPAQKALRLAAAADGRKDTAQEIGVRNLGPAAAAKGEMVSPAERLAELQTTPAPPDIHDVTPPVVAPPPVTVTQPAPVTAWVNTVTPIAATPKAAAPAAASSAFPVKLLLAALLIGVVIYEWK